MLKWCSGRRKFEETLQLGMGYLKDLISRFQEKEERVIPGREIFYLYDTYGFPDIASEILEEEGLSFLKKSLKRKWKDKKPEPVGLMKKRLKNLKREKMKKKSFLAWKTNLYL